MAAAGHPYPAPPAIRRWRDRISRTMSSNKAQAVEVDVAVAEAVCAQDTPLLATAYALESEYRRRKLGLYQNDIATYRRMGLAALASAKKITGDVA